MGKYIWKSPMNIPMWTVPMEPMEPMRPCGQMKVGHGEPKELSLWRWAIGDRRDALDGAAVARVGENTAGSSLRRLLVSLAFRTGAF